MPATFPVNGANGFVKSVWEEELLEAYQSQSILSVVAHQIQPVGVEGKYYINKFNSGGALVEDYDATQPLDYSTVGTTRIEITPDQAKVWAVRLPDINEASIIKSLRQPVIQQAGHELSVAVDRHAMEDILASNVNKKVIANKPKFIKIPFTIKNKTKIKDKISFIFYLILCFYKFTINICSVQIHTFNFCK